MRTIVLAVFVLAQPLAAGAQAEGGAPAAEATAEPPEYAGLIDQALNEYTALNFAEARALFEKAHALFPNARTLRGLGMVEFELRNYRTASDHLSEALASQVRPLDGELRMQTEQLLARAQAFLGQVQLDVKPGTARVLIDGTPIEVTDGTRVVLQVGDHVLEVQAQGFQAEKREVTVRGGDTQTLRVTLSELTSADQSKAVTNSGPGPWPWVLVGTGGAMAIGGAVLVALAQGDIAEVEDADQGTRWSEVEGAYDAAPAKSAAGIVLVGVGAAAIAGGLIWHFVADGSSDDKPVKVATDLQSVTVSGRF